MEDFDTQPDEIEVTELIERIEALEKENNTQKDEISKISTRLAELEDATSAIAEHLAGDDEQ